MKQLKKKTDCDGSGRKGGKILSLAGRCVTRKQLSSEQTKSVNIFSSNKQELLEVFSFSGGKR